MEHKYKNYEGESTPHFLLIYFIQTRPSFRVTTHWSGGKGLGGGILIEIRKTARLLSNDGDGLVTVDGIWAGGDEEGLGLSTDDGHQTLIFALIRVGA